MTFIAIEFDNKVNNTHVKGYLRIPTQFNPKWSLGFREYLTDTYKITGSIEIYPLHVHLDSDTMGTKIAGYTNMEDDFNNALRSNKYYPICDETNSIRRDWAKLDPMSPDFHVKER